MQFNLLLGIRLVIVGGINVGGHEHRLLQVGSSNRDIVDVLKPIVAEPKRNRRFPYARLPEQHDFTLYRRTGSLCTRLLAWLLKIKTGLGSFGCLWLLLVFAAATRH